MKQHISKEDISQLTNEQKEKLRELWEPVKGDIVIIENGYLSYGCEALINNYSKEHNVAYFTLEDGWGSHSKYALNPLLTIGKMIEILITKNQAIEFDRNFYEDLTYKWTVEGFEAEELVDALWIAIKSIL